GIWETWTSPENGTVETCSIITTAANDMAKSIHHRMPVIMLKENIPEWLDPGNKDKEKLLDLLRPFQSQEMGMYKVSTIVNSPGNNTPECVQPVE
ncbi:MAG: SOS response-associated peptidase, partial [bacterium]|nr:SOS response-associated peptidase [bacterium]